MENGCKIETDVKIRSVFSNVISWSAYFLMFSILWIFIPTILNFFRINIWKFSRISSRLALMSFGIKVRRQFYISQDVLSLSRVIYFANHSSWFDQMALCVALEQPLAFLANSKYFSMPLLSVAMRIYNHIPVNTRGNSDAKKQESQKIIATLNAGRSVVVFPEGTRALASQRELSPFRKGIFAIAAQEKIQIIPVHIIGAKEIFSKNTPLLKVKKGIISVAIGEPIVLDEKNWLAQVESIEKIFNEKYLGLVTN